MTTTELVKPRQQRPRTNAPRPSADEQWDFGGWSSPFLGAPIVYTIGVFLYVLEVDWYWPALAGLGFAAPFYASARARGLRQLGVIYTLVASGVATVWLIYASQVLTFNVLELLGTLHHMIAGIVISVPLLVVWLIMVRDAGRARVATYLAGHEQATSKNDDEPQVWEQITKAAGIKKWLVTAEPEVTKDAITVPMQIQPGGTTYREAIARIDALELAANAAFPGAIRLEQPRGQGVATVLIRQALRSTLADEVPAPPVPDEPRSILEPLVDSRFDDGAISGRIHAYQTCVTIGKRNSGKTGLQHVRIDAYASMDDCMLWGVDFKEGRLLIPWLTPFALGLTDRPVFDWAGTSPVTVAKMVEALHAIGGARGAAIPGEKVIPTAALPALRLNLDEIATLAADPTHQRTTQRFLRLVSKRRTEGIDADVATQRGTISFLGPGARDLLSQAGIVDLLKVDSAAEVFNALSVPAEKLGSVDPTTFEHPGTKLSIADGDRLAAARTIRLRIEDIPDRALHYAPWRPRLDALSTEAAGAAYAKRWDTDEARSLLYQAAKQAGDDTAARRWLSDQPALNTDQEETTTTSQAPVVVSPGITFDDTTQTRVNARIAAAALRTAIGDEDFILTKDAIDTLANANPTRWGSLDARSLATMMKEIGVEPAVNLGPKNQRGYTKTALDDAFDM
ncbi:uncharacterized protein DUF3631 [Stackebrandtia endophytica]|uniref:Uncharacterized protein DUF3631 n=1 Tax=Stackebrandtia endophytica TaxID=1496996 RepID=A0A543AWA8_9ACTN|nr:DUF3631 domain-containing protein [Stackebrandtia endophytica]TQL76834.1 uncharacterized protein DUF3631 [Stackebrandtia endophytica]